MSRGFARDGEQSLANSRLGKNNLPTAYFFVAYFLFAYFLVAYCLFSSLPTFPSAPFYVNSQFSLFFTLNKQDFISLVEAPQLLGKQHISSLRGMAADFPYFQTAHILLTKALYNEKHYEFEKQLKHVSLMAPDRAVLFRFIHNINAPVTQESPTAVETLALELNSEVILAEKVTEVTKVDEPIGMNEQPQLEEEAFETPALITLPETIENIPAPVEEPIVQDINRERPAPIERENTRTETILHSSETHSFAEWLQMQQQQKIILDVANKPAEEPVLEMQEKKLPPVLDETPEPQESPSMQDEIAQQVIRSNVNEFESILDKFIRENPRISRGKAEFYNPVNMAKQSVEDNDEIVTETLASVYYKQGHYKKAIRVYEKLCLIYPHKMPYFASLIQKIKTENKD